jgi:hypothetical protein
MQCYLTHECCQCKSKIFMGVRASPAVISMRTLQKYFSHPSLVVYFFATPPIKLKVGQQICEGVLIVNHLDQSLWWANQKHWAVVISYLLHSFLQVYNVTPHFTSHCKLWNCTEQKPFSWAKPACFEFVSSNFIVQGHILSAAWDSLPRHYTGVCTIMSSTFFRG